MSFLGDDDFMELIFYLFLGLSLTYVFSLRIKSHATAMAQIFAFHFAPSIFLLTGYVVVLIYYGLGSYEGILLLDFLLYFINEGYYYFILYYILLKKNK